MEAFYCACAQPSYRLRWCCVVTRLLSWQLFGALSYFAVCWVRIRLKVFLLHSSTVLCQPSILSRFCQTYHLHIKYDFPHSNHNSTCFFPQTHFAPTEERHLVNNIWLFIIMFDFIEINSYVIICHLCLGIKKKPRYLGVVCLVRTCRKHYLHVCRWILNLMIRVSVKNWTRHFLCFK